MKRKAHRFQVFVCTVMASIFVYNFIGKAEIMKKIQTEKRIDKQIIAVDKLNLRLPNLMITNYNPQNGKVTIKNSGVADAVFSKEAPILSGSYTMVPANGRIKAGETIEVQLNSAITWVCPKSISDDYQYGTLVSNWNYSEKAPRDEDGNVMLLVDPNNIISESNETNNTYRLQRPNPYKTSNPPGSLPDLKIIEGSAKIDGNLLRYNLKVKNEGTGKAFLCGYFSTSEYAGNILFGVKIDGKDQAFNITFVKAPYIMNPGDTKEMWDQAKISHQEFGAATEGLTPGCHKLEFTADPYNKIPESDESNNSLTISYPTGGASCP